MPLYVWHRISYGIESFFGSLDATRVSGALDWTSMLPGELDGAFSSQVQLQLLAGMRSGAD